MSVNFFPYSMSKHGEVLSGRDAGRAAGREVQSALEDDGAVLLSFQGVRVASPSYLEEVARGARAALVGGDTQRYLLLDGLDSEDVEEALRMVLDKLKMLMVSIDPGDENEEQVKLLGGSRQLTETLQAARSLGSSFSVRELADELELKLPALHQRLQALLEAGAVARVPDAASDRGRRHVYSVPETPAGLHKVA